MKRNISMKKRLFFMSVTPMIITIILLASYFYSMRIQDLKDNLRIQGQSMVKQLSQSSRYSILTADNEDLFELTNFSSNDNPVDSVAIYDKDKHLLAYNGLKKDYLVSKKDLEHLTTEDTHLHTTGHTYSFTAPVRMTQEYIDRYDLGKYVTDKATFKDGEIVGWVTVNLSCKDVFLEEYQTIAVLLLISFLGILVSFMFSTSLSKHLISPVLSLIETVRQLKRGHLNARATVPNDSELGSLAEGVNEMAHSLSAARQDLQESVDQATCDLRETLETIETQNIELSMAQKKALKASAVKSEFIANMSHEIKTPMNSIIGFTRLLHESPLSVMQRDYVSTISNASETLMALINNVLDFSKIESGKLRLESVPMNLHDCIEEVMLTLSHRAHAKQLELTCMIQDEVPSNIIGDPMRIKQILNNVITNAIKFTDSGSVIVRVFTENQTQKDAEICISITDTGIGLTENEQKNIFKAFNHANPTISTEFGGTGLGLVISKKLLDQMQGRISLESKRGKGSTFLINFVCQAIAEGSGESKLLTDLSDKHILLYEPHPITRFAVCNQLKKWGASCTEASDTQQLKAQLGNESKYDLIIIGMHQAINFAGFAESILKHVPKENDTPLMVLCNSAEQYLTQYLKETGKVAAAFPKPILKHAFLDEIKRLFAAHGKKGNVLTFNTAGTPLPLGGVSILSIDDNMHNNHLVKTILERSGAKVTTAEDGNYGVLLATKHHYDIILMDLRMPNMDGISATGLIRKNHCINHEKPIIAVSAHIAADEKNDLLEKGFTNYLTKPINEKQIVSMILAHLKKSGVKQTEVPDQAEEVEYSNDHIDLILGKKLAGGKEQLAIEMLEMLAENIPEDLEIIKASYDEKDYNKMQSMVHRFHGAVCYAGTPRLKRLTESLETLLKTKKLETLDVLYEEFLKEIDIVQVEIAHIAKEKLKEEA